ncbi:MAG: RnfABCDGE type electron transport complex subunit D [Alphaproteobacteria bacterium]
MILSTDKSGPFGHAPNSVHQTMTLVMLALLPATLFNAWLFGWPAILMFLVSIGSCMAVEAAWLSLSGLPVRPALSDGSAILTGWLMAMSIPPWSPWWMVLIGAVFAIWMAKHLYGGLGQNVFNPAMVGRTAILISFPLQMTTFVAPKPLFTDGAPGLGEAFRIIFGGQPLDSISSASALGLVKTELSRGVPVNESMAKVPGLADMMLGYHAGSFGETASLLILAGGLFLLYRRVISWHIPVTVIGTVFLMATIAHLADPGRYASGVFHVLSGATLLGAFFIATDYVTSPVSKQGQLVFGVGVGLLTWVIRTYAGYPEGMGFAVLLMNAMTPLIDHHIRPRTFGRTRKGEPLAVGGKS